MKMLKRRIAGSRARLRDHTGRMRPGVILCRTLAQNPPLCVLVTRLAPAVSILTIWRTREAWRDASFHYSRCGQPCRQSPQVANWP
jgi:hypothetical protein